jgi:hypothetical protein
MTLSQTGDVPEGAEAIRFVSFGERLSLGFNGTPIPLVYVPRPLEPRFPQVYDVYGDVSAFGGQIGALSFTTVDHDRILVGSGLHSISFIVPEPKTWVLLGVGVFGLLRGWRRAGCRRSQQSNSVGSVAAKGALL